MAPMKVGPCRGSFPRWHYNAASQKCEHFIFGGCRENLNNYLSKDECTNACSGSGMSSVLSLSYADFLSFFPFLCHVWMSTFIDFKFALIVLLKHSDLLIKIFF